MGSWVGIDVGEGVSMGSWVGIDVGVSVGYRVGIEDDGPVSTPSSIPPQQITSRDGDLDPNVVVYTCWSAHRL